MSLSDLASLGSGVGGIAVLVSLIYLALQVRQAERNQQAAITLARTTRTIDMLMRFTEPDFAEINVKLGRGGEGITAIELQQLTSFLASRFAHWEDSFYQHEARLMSDRAFRRAANLMRFSMSNAAHRVAWGLVRGLYEADFCGFIDRLVVEVPVAATEYPLDVWRAQMTVELAGAFADGAPKIGAGPPPGVAI